MVCSSKRYDDVRFIRSVLNRVVMVVVWVRYHGYSLGTDDCYPTGTDRPKREGTRAYARVVDRRLIDECLLHRSPSTLSFSHYCRLSLTPLYHRFSFSFLYSTPDPYLLPASGPRFERSSATSPEYF